MHNGICRHMKLREKKEIPRQCWVRELNPGLLDHGDHGLPLHLQQHIQCQDQISARSFEMGSPVQNITRLSDKPLDMQEPMSSGLGSRMIIECSDPWGL